VLIELDHGTALVSQDLVKNFTGQIHRDVARSLQVLYHGVQIVGVAAKMGSFRIDNTYTYIFIYIYIYIY